jgi:hypothetical protein
VGVRLPRGAGLPGSTSRAPAKEDRQHPDERAVGEAVGALDDLARRLDPDGSLAWVEVSWAACRVSSGALAPDAALQELADSADLPAVVRDLLRAGQSGLAGRIDMVWQADADDASAPTMTAGGNHGRP